MQDFSEFKYQATLRKQLATTLHHIFTVVGPSPSESDREALEAVFSEDASRPAAIAVEIAAVCDLIDVIGDGGGDKHKDKDKDLKEYPALLKMLGVVVPVVSIDEQVCNKSGFTDQPTSPSTLVSN